MAALLALAAVVTIAGCSAGPKLSEDAAVDACERAALEQHRTEYERAAITEREKLSKSAAEKITFDNWIATWDKKPDVKLDDSGAFAVDTSVEYVHKALDLDPWKLDVSCIVEQDWTAHVARDGRSAVETYLVDKCSDKLDAAHTSKEGAFYINDAEFHRDDDGRYISGSASYFYTDDSGEDDGEYTCRFNDKREITDTSVEWK